MKIAFRVDASLEIGTGHVMRCLTLADELCKCGATCFFICRQHPGNLAELIQERGFEVFLLGDAGQCFSHLSNSIAHASWLGCKWQEDAEQTICCLEHIQPDWLITDHYALDVKWEQKLRPYCNKFMVIDDLADRVHECDLLLDQNLVPEMEDRYLGKIPEDCLKLLGPKYALLQPIYAEIHERLPHRNGTVGRILVSFGGVDTYNLAGRVLSAFIQLDQTEIDVDVVIPSNSLFLESTNELVRDCNNIHIYSDLPTLSSLMKKADLAIGASGATSWERCCLGVPAMVYSIANNQDAIARGLSDAGACDYLGKLQDEVNIEKTIRSKLSEWLADCKGLQSMSEIARSITDGLGGIRVAQALEKM